MVTADVGNCSVERMYMELTLEQLNEMEPGIFETGLTIDNQTGINVNNTNEVLRWVAVRGAINDWAIYVGSSLNSIELIQQLGDKIYSRENILKLVPCTQEAYNRYRI